MRKLGFVLSPRAYTEKSVRIVKPRQLAVFGGGGENGIFQSSRAYMEKESSQPIAYIEGESLFKGGELKISVIPMNFPYISYISLHISHVFLAKIKRLQFSKGRAQNISKPHSNFPEYVAMGVGDGARKFPNKAWNLGFVKYVKDVKTKKFLFNLNNYTQFREKFLPFLSILLRELYGQGL